MTTVLPGQQWTVTLGGYPLTLVPDPSAASRDDAPAYGGSYETEESDLTFRKRDVPVFLRRFDRGAGFVELRDGGDDGGYAWAEDMNMWGGNGVLPSGLRAATAAGYGLGATSGAVIDSVLFGGSLYGITSVKHGLKWTLANPGPAPSYSPALNEFGDATASFHTGFAPKAITLFRDASGTPIVVISAYNSGTGATRLYTSTSGTAGTWSSAVIGYRADSMAVTWWEGRDGAGAKRLLIQADDVTIRHCIAGQDPLLTASYVTPIEVADPGYRIIRILAAPAHAFALTTGGIMDFNEQRVWCLTDYWKEQAYAGTTVLATGARVYDDHIVAARNAGLDRYDLGLNGGQQRLSGECGPMAFMQDGTPIRGFATGTSFPTHDGWLLVPIYNSELGASFVMRGKDRRALNINVPNPMLWHGAEQAIKGTDTLITHMTVAPVADGTSRTYLWMFAIDNYKGIQSNNLYYAPLPAGSGPLAYQMSGGTFTHNTASRLYFTAQTWQDRNATKIVRRYDVVSRRATLANNIQIWSRSDGDPTTLADISTWTGEGTITTGTRAITPNPQVSGNSIALLAVLTTVSPYTAPPILHELRARAAVRTETFKTRRIWVVLEHDYELVGGVPDLADPDATFAAIAALQSAGYQEFVDEAGGSETVLVEQGLTFARGDVGDGDWRTLVKLDLSTVA